MPNCDFYAAGSDHELVLEFVFAAEDCDVYELASPVDTSLARFRTLAELRERYGIASWDDGGAQALLLQVRPHDARGQVHVEKTVFGPDYRGPGRYREASGGWGLIQLYLEAVRGERLRPSHTSHNSEKRALAREAVYPHLGAAASWDWAAVGRWSRRLNRYIRTRGVATHDGRAVLPGAQRLAQSGITLAGA